MSPDLKKDGKHSWLTQRWWERVLVSVRDAEDCHPNTNSLVVFFRMLLFYHGWASPALVAGAVSQSTVLRGVKKVNVWRLAKYYQDARRDWVVKYKRRTPRPCSQRHTHLLRLIDRYIQVRGQQSNENQTSETEWSDRQAAWCWTRNEHPHLLFDAAIHEEDLERIYNREVTHGQSSLQKIAPTANQFQTVSERIQVHERANELTPVQAAYTHAQTGPVYSSPANNDPTNHINQSPALPLPPSANDEIQPRGGKSDPGYALVDDQATPAAPEREPEGQEIQTKHENKKKKTKKNKEKKQKEEYSRMRNTSQDLEILDVESVAPDVAHLASTVSSRTTSDSNVKTSTGSQESRREALEIVVGIVDKTREAKKHIEEADSSMKKA